MKRDFEGVENENKGCGDVWDVCVRVCVRGGQ